MNILSNFYNRHINNIGNTQKVGNTQQPIINRSEGEDVFVKSKSPNEIFAENLFGPGGLEKEYNQMAKSLGLIHPPKFSLDVSPEDVKAGRGGAYNFASNELRLDLSQYNKPNLKKLYVNVNKDGKDTKMPLILPFSPMPVIAQQEDCETFQKNNSKLRLSIEPATNEDVKKIILQSLYHELVHAQQHELMARTEGIGAKRIIEEKGFAFLKPEQINDPRRLQWVEKEYNNSPWKDYTDVENTIRKDSREGCVAYQILKANYNYIGNPNAGDVYYNNLIEKDAYSRAAQYIYQRFGSL